MKEVKKFKETEKGTFSYWAAHWKAYNSYAIKQGVWKFKYLFHDFEKPWLNLVMNYEKVKKYHREHSRHHLEYKGTKPFDYDAMIIDWEVSRFTKEDAPLDAIQTLDRLYSTSSKVTNSIINSICSVVKDFTVCRQLNEYNWEFYISKLPALKDNFNEDLKGMFINQYLFLIFENGKKVKIGWGDTPRGTLLTSQSLFNDLFLR
jgi:hypothetical protein